MVSNPCKYLVFLFILLLPNLLAAQTLNAEVEATINLDDQGEVYTVTATAFNKTEIKQSLRYRLSVVLNDKTTNNREVSNEEERFVIEPLQKVNLSSRYLYAEENQRIIVFLLIFKDTVVISKDRIVINGFEGEDGLKPMVMREGDSLAFLNKEPQEDVVLLKGLVFEDTKTKPGRDFYKLFYSLYTSYNINGEEIVKVQEVLGIGGTTQMRIYVGQDLVTQFFLNPRFSYLEETAKQSVFLVSRHLQQLKESKKQQIRY
jgi:hypothetical protein